MLERLWRKRKTFLHCWWECKLVQPQWMEGPQEAIESPCDPPTPLLAIYLDKTAWTKTV